MLIYCHSSLARQNSSLNLGCSRVRLCKGLICGLATGVQSLGSSSCPGLQRSYLGTDPPSDLDLSGYNIKVNMLGVEFKQGCQDIETTLTF